MKPSDLIPGVWTEENITEKFVNRAWNGLCIRMKDENIFGGYLEDRSPLFDDRHDPVAKIHIGVDLWSPQYTPIIFPYDAVVKYSRPSNKKCRGGWGGRLDLFVPDKGVYILGHLEEPYQKIGDRITAGEVVASLAGRKNNGGWRPHLHIQLMLSEYYDIFDPNHIDAYAEPNSDLSQLYPNPFYEFTPKN